MDNRQRGIGSIPVRKLQSGGFTGTDEDYRNAYELSRPAPDYGPPRPVTASPIANIGPGMYYSLQQPSPNLSHSEYLKALAKDPEFIKFKEDNPHAAAEFENMNPAVENRTFNRAKAFEPFHTREQISPDQQFDVATQTFFTPRKNWAGTKIDEYGRAGQEKQLENVYRQLDAIDQLNTTQARNAGRELLPAERMMAVGVKDDYNTSGPAVILHDPSRGRFIPAAETGQFMRGDPSASYEQAKNILPYEQAAAILGITNPFPSEKENEQILDFIEKKGVPSLPFMEYDKGTFLPSAYGLSPRLAAKREYERTNEVKPLDFLKEYLNLTPYQGPRPTIYQFPELTTIKPIKPLAAGGAVDASDDTTGQPLFSETGAVPAGVPSVSVRKPTLSTASPTAVPTASASTAAGMLNALPGGQTPTAQGSSALSAASPTFTASGMLAAMPTTSAGAVLQYEHPYINPITGERKTVTGGMTGGGAPAGFIDAFDPNIYGGQQSDLAVGRGFFAKGDTVNLSPLLNNKDPGQGPVRVDQNIGNVQLPGKSTDYTYEQAGNTVRVKDKSGNVVSQIAVQADVDGTQLKFADGTVGAIPVKKDGSWEIQLGGKPAGGYTGIVTGDDTGGDTVSPLPSPTLPPYEEGVADPTIPMPPIDARPVTPVTVPPINQSFLDSPVRQWDPVTQSFKYGSPTSLSPATGPGGAGGSGYTRANGTPIDLPRDWNTYTVENKAAWFNRYGVTPADLMANGLSQADIDVLRNAKTPYTVTNDQKGTPLEPPQVASWTPPGVTLRRPSLLQVATSDQPPKDPYDAKSGIYTIPTYSESQQFAINREQLLGAVGSALGGKKYTTPQYYNLLSMARSGAFGAPGTPDFATKLQAALASLAAAQAANNTVTGGTGNDTTTGGTGNDKQEDTSGD